MQHNWEHAGYNQPPATVVVVPSQQTISGGPTPQQSYPYQTQHALEHAGYDQPPAGVVVVHPQQTTVVTPEDTSHVTDNLIANIFACILCPGCCWILGKQL